GGNAQTILPALYARSRPLFRAPARAGWRRERWDTPDGDFIDVDWQSARPEANDAAGATASAKVSDIANNAADATPERPLLVLFHGLEGSSASHYAVAFGDWARRQGWSFAVPHFRGCSGELNRGPRAYHSGDFTEIDWVLKRFRSRHTGPLLAVGVSLGGNALMLWAAESGEQAGRVADAVASICSPLDLTAAGHAIGRGFNRLVYTPMFLKTMKPKALAKLAQHPGLFDGVALSTARDLYQFDDLFTAPLHGFRNVADYWQRASAKPHLARIRIPALALNALNDPFVPASSLPRQSEVGNCVTLWQPGHGGHVGFPRGRPGELRALPEAVGGWLAEAAGIAGLRVPAQASL
ncbi:MAG: alpha/beta fold hydrolase, partial [Burkholderiales bacterium]